MATLLIAGISLGAQAAGPAPSTPPQAARPPARESGTVRFFANPEGLPKFTARTLDGKTVTSDQWRGKVTLINFWATWCGPCRVEIPDLVLLQAKYRDHVQILGISADHDDDIEEVKKFVAAHRMNFPVAIMTPELEKLFPEVTGLPTTFVVDREGRVVQKHMGALNPATIELEARVLAGLAPGVTVQRTTASKPD